MSTRFFENQEAARRRTSWLVFLFGCAVVGIVALLYVAAVLIAAGLPQTDAYGRVVASRVAYWQPDLFVQVALATLAVVSAGSLYKIWQLQSGGAIVAEHLGGRLIPTDTSDPEARRILNVVEEMAIASGTPTPPVYLLPDEEGINAFAAGFTPSDAVIGVTRGCIHHLTRDELQGVIAHEFSHILSGDMRLNLRLMGAVHGILLLGIIGYFLLRSSVFAGRRTRRDNAGTVMLLGGLALVVVGFLGTFFGNLIKASVSRQREFLADASAVQFTRNPDGIAGALKKIRSLAAGSFLVSPAAPEASHLFFGQGLRGGFQALFATHPPLAERIRRLDPSWQEDELPSPGATGREPPGATEAKPAGAAGFAGETARQRTAPSAVPGGTALDGIGEPTPAHLEYAARLLASLPAAIVSACHEPHGARAVVYALLIDQDADTRRRQLAQIERFGEPGIARETQALLRGVELLDPRARLPLVDLALPALRRLSPGQFAAFERNLTALVEADRRIELFEWTLQRILLTHLAPHFEQTASRATHDTPLSRSSAECAVVLSTLARFGSAGEDAIRKAFDAGAALLPRLALALLPEERSDLAALDTALSRLASTEARGVEQLLRACAATIASDGRVSEAQGEVIRAIADTLGVPMPPLLPGQKLA